MSKKRKRNPVKQTSTKTLWKQQRVANFSKRKKQMKQKEAGKLHETASKSLPKFTYSFRNFLDFARN